MRIIIIPEDNFCSVDGEGLHFDFSNLITEELKNVHALQWYDNWGDVEHKTVIGYKQIIKDPNIQIDELGDFQAIVDAYFEKKAEVNNS